MAIYKVERELQEMGLSEKYIGVQSLYEQAVYYFTPVYNFSL